MINGLGVVGWGVGGIEAESVMMGENISMVLPEVVGFKMVGDLPKTATATDLVLTCTEMLRKYTYLFFFITKNCYYQAKSCGKVCRILWSWCSNPFIS